MRPPHLLAAVLMFASLTLAGCIGPSASSEGAAGAPLVDARALPPGCDAARPAVAHRAGGTPVEPPGSRPLPCVSYVGGVATEPTLGVSPTTGAVFFFPAAQGSGNVQPEGFALARSVDEGATWERFAPATAGVSPHVVDLDPYLFLDASTGRVFVDNLATVNCSVLSWSDDEGATWTHSLSGCMETDHQTLFAGPPRTSVTVGYPNVVYRCAMNAVALDGLSTMATCQRSLDGGLTWLPPGGPVFQTLDAPHLSKCDPALGHGAVDAQGRVYLPKGHCGQPWLAMSDDEGLTWSRVQVSGLGMHREPDGSPGHEAGVGLDAAGNVYYFWIAEDRLPYLAASQDAGASWSEPRMVGAPGVREATLPALAVGEDGRVALLYLGSTDSPGAPFPASECPDVVCVGPPPQPAGYERVTRNGYLATSLDALSKDAVFYSVSVNDPRDPLVRGACGAGRCQGVFDFLDVQLGPDGSVWGSFVDTCVDACPTSVSTQDNAREGLVGRLWWPAGDLSP